MKKIIFIACICCAFFIMGCGKKDQADKFKKALYYTEIGRFNDALKIYATIIKESPNNFAAYTNRGIVYEKVAALDIKNRSALLTRAEQDYIKAAQLNPYNVQALNNLGAFYIDQKRFYNALIYLNEAVRYAPTYYAAIVNRGIANYNAGEGIKAYNDFHKAIELNKNGWLAYLNRGLFFYDVEDYLGAALDFTRVINVRPNYARAYLERGRALKMDNLYADAMSDFRTAVALDPANAVSHYYLGEMYFKSGDVPSALSELTKSKELDPGFVPTYELMGDILAVEDAVAAAANYIICKKLSPSNAARYDFKIRQMLTDDGRARVVRNRFL